MSKDIPPSERDVPYFEIGPTRVFFDGSYNWIVEEQEIREPDDGDPHTEWTNRRFYPTARVAIRVAANAVIERQGKVDTAEEMLEALNRVAKTIDSLSEDAGKPGLENVEPYEMPLP